jgi:hypothetical protein
MKTKIYDPGFFVFDTNFELVKVKSYKHKTDLIIQGQRYFYKYVPTLRYNTKSYINYLKQKHKLK